MPSNSYVDKPAEAALITRLRMVLGKNLNQSDIDFIHVLGRPDVLNFTFNYLIEKDESNAH